VENVVVDTGQEMPLYAVARIIVEKMGGRIAMNREALSYRDGEIWWLVGDNARARTILGWRPSVSLEEELERTILAEGGREST